MTKFIDITGFIFGDLTVLYRNGTNKDLKGTWLCRCSCGNTITKTSKCLRKSKDPHLNCGAYQHPTKVCTGCGIEKNKSEYHVSKGKMGIQPKCKSCKCDFYLEVKEERKLKWKDNLKYPEFRKRRLVTSRKSYYKNIESQKAYKKIYTKKPEVIARAKEIRDFRKENDIGYNLKLRTRTRLRDVIKIIGKKHKHTSSLLLLGCDIKFFKSYIENKFVNGMCWERISEIHIDHIKPLSLFDLKDLEQQKVAFHYTNTQPLWWKDNLEKNAKY